jgi:hypothetical protein
MTGRRGSNSWSSNSTAAENNHAGFTPPRDLLRFKLSHVGVARSRVREMRLTTQGKIARRYSHIRTATLAFLLDGARATMDAPQPDAGRTLVVYWPRPIPVNVRDLADLVPTVRLVKWTCMGRLDRADRSHSQRDVFGETRRFSVRKPAD